MKTAEQGRMHYRDHHDQGAAGAPLILLHGAGGDSMHWPGALRRMPGRRVVALDLAGHGRSAGPPRESIAEYAEDVRRFAKALGLERPVLVGHSMGGAIALEIALCDPGLPAALVLLATGARLPVSPQLLDAVVQDFDQASGLLSAWAYGRQADGRLTEAATRRLETVDPALLLADLRACAAFDRSAELGRIVAPTLVMCGSADRMTPPALSEELASGLAHAWLHIVAGAGHMLILESQGEVAQHIAAFLGKAAA